MADRSRDWFKQVLDTFYVATRYANGHVEGAPFEHPLQSSEAIRYAGEIIEFVSARLADPGANR
jgi:HEPN domain-containing protein